MIPFVAVAPDIDESPKDDELPAAMVQRLAIEKARAVASAHPGAVVIGSDQTAVQNGRAVGKPVDHDDAVRQLTSASGNTVTLYTGLSVLDTRNDQLQVAVEPFQVTFRPLTRRVIENYLNKEKPYGCCGSLRADGLGIALLDRLDGEDPSALIGLPLIRLVRMLENTGIDPVSASDPALASQ